MPTAGNPASARRAWRADGLPLALLLDHVPADPPGRTGRELRLFAVECARAALTTGPGDVLGGLDLEADGASLRSAFARRKRPPRNADGRAVLVDTADVVEAMADAPWEGFAALRLALRHLELVPQKWEDDPERYLAWTITEPDPRRAAVAAAAVAADVILGPAEGDGAGAPGLRDVLRVVYDRADNAAYGLGSPPWEDSGYRDRPDEDKAAEREEWYDSRERAGEAPTPDSPALAALWPFAKEVINRSRTGRGFDFAGFEAEAAPLVRRLIRDRVAARQGEVLRGLFGDPFGRPVRVADGWRTAAVLGLVDAIRLDRAFDRMPELAAALAAAGCSSAPVLNHLRGGGPHVPGCWVLDLLAPVSS